MHEGLPSVWCLDFNLIGTHSPYLQALPRLMGKTMELHPESSIPLVADMEGSKLVGNGLLRRACLEF